MNIWYIFWYINIKTQSFAPPLITTCCIVQKKHEIWNRTGENTKLTEDARCPWDSEIFADEYQTSIMHDVCEQHNSSEKPRFHSIKRILAETSNYHVHTGNIDSDKYSLVNYTLEKAGKEAVALLLSITIDMMSNR